MNYLAAGIGVTVEEAEEIGPEIYEKLKQRIHPRFIIGIDYGIDDAKRLRDLEHETKLTDEGRALRRYRQNWPWPEEERT